MLEKILKIQQELKAPKNQKNSFGNYNYRSCEDILEAVKPLLKETKCILSIQDELVQIGERYYIKATATITDIESKEQYINTAYARESLEKKGMDDSQITGATSSYARKYALNGLFLIDDTKDADTDEYQKQTTKKEPTYREQLTEYCSKKKIDKSELANRYKIDAKTTEERYKEILTELKVSE